MYETKRMKGEKSKIENKTAYTHKQTMKHMQTTLLTAASWGISLTQLSFSHPFQVGHAVGLSKEFEEISVNS